MNKLKSNVIGALLWAILCTGKLAAAADTDPSPAIMALATRVWTIADVVAKQHDKPCPRAQMIEAGVKALYLAAKMDLPADSERRSGEVANSAQLAAFMDPAFRKADKPTQAKLEEAVLQGVLSSVPGKASLVEPPSQKELAVQEQISGNRYVGIGIALRLAKTDKKPVVTTTILHGAARKAGMKTGDVIESVDGKDSAGITLGQVIDWLRGADGSPVTVVVRQPGALPRAERIR